MKDVRTRVLVADDHPLFRRGLVDAVNRRSDLELVGEATTGREALEQIRSLEPDVAVIDMKMPALTGMEVMQALTIDQIETRIMFLSGYLEGTTVYEAVEAGARGYLSKESDAEDVCEAIAAIARGETVIGPESAGAIVDEIRLRAPSADATLSKRELEIMRLTADGHSAPEIAGQLFLSTATVKTYLHRIYQKLDVTDRAAAVAEAMRRGILQ